MQREETLPAVILFAIAATTLAGCGHEEHGVTDETMCEYMKNPVSPLAGATDRASAPQMTLGSTPYEVTLDAAMPTHVRFELPSVMTVGLNAGTAGILTGKYFLGAAERTLPEGVALAACAADVPAHHHLASAEAGTYVLELGAGTGTVVLLAAEMTDHGH